MSKRYQHPDREKLNNYFITALYDDTLHITNLLENNGLSLKEKVIKHLKQVDEIDGTNEARRFNYEEWEKTYIKRNPNYNHV